MPEKDWKERVIKQRENCTSALSIAKSPKGYNYKIQGAPAFHSSCFDFINYPDVNYPVIKLFCQIIRLCEELRHIDFPIRFDIEPTNR